MQSFFIAFNAVMPISFLVILGYYLKEKQYLVKESIKNLNRLCFILFLPMLTFNNITKANVKQLIDLKLFVYVIASIIITILLGSIIIHIVEKDNKKQGSLIQGIYRSNFVILGIPLTNYIVGEKGAVIASILIMVVIPVYNVLAVLILATHSGKNTDFKKLILEIAKNPLIIASVFAIISSFLNIQIPSFLDKIISDLSKIGSVLPMIMLGSMLDFNTISSNIKNIVIGVISKLIIVPLIFIPIAIYIGFSVEKIVALIAIYCSPTSVSSAIMAQQMDCDGQLATHIVIFTTVISCFTIFLWVFVLDFFKFI